MEEALGALRLLASCHMDDAPSREWGNRTLVEAAFVCDDDDRNAAISAVLNFADVAGVVTAEVDRLRAEVDRHAGGMRQLLAQRDAAEAALEDVRQMTRHQNWAGIVDLLVEGADRG